MSKIERCGQSPTTEDVKTWAAACSADGQLPDLLASLDVIDSMYVEWRALERTGMRQVQDARRSLYEHAALLRIYESTLIPSLLQTDAYARALMGRVAEFCAVPGDIEEAVKARVQSQRVLQEGVRLAVVLEHAALRVRTAGRDAMIGQLGHLINVATWPNVALGIVPDYVDRAMWPGAGFWIFDSEMVRVETYSADLTITQPSEVDLYGRTFAALATMALNGAQARDLILQEIARLEDE